MKGILSRMMQIDPKLKLVVLLFITLIFNCFISTPIRAFEAAPVDSTLIKKITNLGNEAWNLKRTEPEKAIELCKLGISHAKDINKSDAEADFYNTLGVTYKYEGLYDSALFYYQKAFEVHKNAQNVKGMASSLTNQAILLAKQGDYSKSVAFYKKALEIAETNQLESFYENILMNYTNLLNNIGRSEEALKLMNQVKKNVDYFEKNKANYYGNLANIYKDLGYFELAISAALQSIQFETDSFGLYQTYSILGNFYTSTANWDRAKSYFSRAHTFFQTRNEVEDATVLGNLAIVYKNLGQLDSALTWIRMSEKCLNELENSVQHAYNFQELAKILKLQQKVDSSMYYYQKALSRFAAIGDSSSMALIHSEMAILSLKDFPTKAKNYWELANQVPNKYKTLELRSQLALDGARIFQRSDQDKAIALYQMHIQLQDSLLNIENQKAIREMEIKYESEKQAHTIENLRIENQLHEKQVQVARLWLWAILVSIGILALFAYYLFVLFRKRKQTEKLQARISAREELRGRIAADLHDKVCSDLMGARYKFRQLNKGDNNHEKKMEMEQLLENIYTDTRNISRELQSPDWGKIEWEKFISSCASQTGIAAAMDFSLQSEDLQAWNELNNETKAALNLVIREAFVNILKHSEAKKVNVNVNTVGLELQIEISDDGVGFTPGRNKNGNGIKNMEKRIRKIKGKINFQKNENRGTNLFIQVPIN